LLGWLIRSLKRPPPDTRIEDELRNQISSLHARITALTTEVTELATSRGTLEGEKASLLKQLDSEKEALLQVQTKLQKDFEAAAAKLLTENSTQFSRQSSESLEKLLAPLREKFTEFNQSMEQTRARTLEHSTLLKEEIKRIGDEAANLSKALQGEVKILGNWGENMLNQILEKSGLQQGLHYRAQQSAKTESGEHRFLDVVIDLPEKRNLIVDSKASLASYQQAVSAVDKTQQLAHMDAHVAALRTHFRGLGAKRYQELYGISAPDFVLMYIPIEGAFTSAIAHEPALFAEALEFNVVLITNSTLLATLRTVAHVWRLADQQKHALLIADRGGKLYDKFVGFVEDLEGIKKSLAAAQNALSGAAGKLSTGPGNLVRQAEQLKELGVKAAKAMPPALLEQAGQDDAINSTLLPETRDNKSGL
jgi:DNA recombination protein RmuC